MRRGNLMFYGIATTLEGWLTMKSVLGRVSQTRRSDRQVFDPYNKNFHPPTPESGGTGKSEIATAHEVRFAMTNRSTLSLRGASFEQSHASLKKLLRRYCLISDRIMSYFIMLDFIIFILAQMV